MTIETACSQMKRFWRQKTQPLFARDSRSLTAHLILRHLQVMTIIIVLALIGQPAHSAELCSEVFSQSDSVTAAETLKPMITERVAKNKFVTNRHLVDYSRELHSDFARRLTLLSSNQHWVDLGAGKALAQIDYIKSFRDSSAAPLCTAVAFKLDRWFSPSSFHGKLKTAEGAFESLPTSTWQKVDVVTDVYGVLSYTGDLSRSLQKTFDMMNVGGELYMLVSAWGAQVKVGTQKLPLTTFLKSIPGIQIEGSDTQIKITKMQETISVPHLNLTSYKDEGPPIRVFEQASP